MELETTLNGAPVTLVYEVDTDTVACYDSGTGCDYEKSVPVVTLEAVMYEGTNITGPMHLDDYKAMELECYQACNEMEAA